MPRPRRLHGAAHRTVHEKNGNQRNLVRPRLVLCLQFSGLNCGSTDVKAMRASPSSLAFVRECKVAFRRAWYASCARVQRALVRSRLAPRIREVKIVRAIGLLNPADRAGAEFDAAVTSATYRLTALSNGNAARWSPAYPGAGGGFQGGSICATTTRLRASAAA